MEHKALTIPEKSALLVLMLIGSEVPNSEINKIYGFDIDKKVREGLAERGLIETRYETRPRRRYVHWLTEEGWAQGRRELTEPLPDRADKSFRVLHGVLTAIDAHLTRTRTDLKPFLHAPAPADVAERIESAYDSLVGRPGGWVSLTRLRGALDGVPRAQLDDALRQLSRKPDVYLIPEANQKILTPEDRAAAVDLGGEAKHLLSIERS